MKDFKVDFVGIGAAKAGTTWLAACLGEHPEVCMSNPKELRYFCGAPERQLGRSEYEKGEKWLRRRFSGCRPGQLRGEFSVRYLTDPLSPVLIKRHFPLSKIVVSFRNPADSLYSLYNQRAKEYAVPDTFEAFLEEYPNLIQNGFYYSHMTRYLECFPSDRIHMILYDAISATPAQVLTSLFQFLDIDSTFAPARTFERVNVSAVPRSVLVRDLVAGTVRFFRMNPVASPLKDVLNVLGVHHIANWILRRNLRSAARVPMNEETRNWLVELYEPHNHKLGELLGRDLSHWNE